MSARQPNQPIVFRANLSDRQSSLMMSGRGDRLLIELEAFGMDAVMALIGLTKYTGQSFRVTVEELPPNTLTEIDGETEEGAKAQVITVGRGGSSIRRDQRAGE